MYRTSAWEDAQPPPAARTPVATGGRRGAPEFQPFARQGSKAAACRQLERTAEPASLPCSKPGRRAREARVAATRAETRKQCRSGVMGPAGPRAPDGFPSIPPGDRPKARSARLRQARGPDEPRKRLSEERPGLALRRGPPALPPDSCRRLPQMEGQDEGAEPRIRSRCSRRAPGSRLPPGACASGC